MAAAAASSSTSTSSFGREFVQRWRESQVGPGDLPFYDAHDAGDVARLAGCTSTPLAFHLGTGTSLFTTVLLPAVLAARAEVLFVTCFWAPSASLTALSDALRRLAVYRESTARTGDHKVTVPPLRVRIGLSSMPSLWQKLLHTSAPAGYVYPPHEWARLLGLPDRDTLEAGRIELRVKSLFFTPFSLVHPKFVVVDRERAFLPSCNVSWEAWLEGCVEMRGEAVASLVDYYARTWEPALELQRPASVPEPAGQIPPLDGHQAGLKAVASPVHSTVAFTPVAATVPTLLLPSSHHRNPAFRPFFWQSPPPAPATPLNIALLQLLASAAQSIYVQTPDVTAAPAVDALLAALERGVHVTVVTSRNIKPGEQLLTAGTTTPWCLRGLVRRYVRLAARSLVLEPGEVEALRPRLGDLRVSYFGARAAAERVEDEEPVHTHVKVTLVDGRYAVLGSGNMDRASWFTSQELGILFEHVGFATSVRKALDQALEGRLECLFDSAHSGT
ncbi:hypothetical protein P8C59_004942 [Phyllachora maydis]|uniref:PLD phosphodiesterase domain-containing protein n=1 Tax=Phyllachora maydis TaxID=1825666 RepID=A0AAD9I4M0_9PEZI|nr:hypothetical protein P8C59_004942 [Phyllachora maydis]